MCSRVNKSCKRLREIIIKINSFTPRLKSDIQSWPIINNMTLRVCAVDNTPRTSINCCDLASLSLLAASCLSDFSISLAILACSLSILAAARAACCLLATSILCSTGRLVRIAALMSSSLQQATQFRVFYLEKSWKNCGLQFENQFVSFC